MADIIRQGGVTDHGSLTGLTDDDHTQYQKESEKGQASGYAALDAASFVEAKGLQFPATQVPSADGNALDDYEEGTFTPVLTFATPGDLNVAYTAQEGFYTKIGNAVVVQFEIITSTFTHGTASGACQLTGLPFQTNGSGNSAYGVEFQGITKANYTQFYAATSIESTTIFIQASGSGQNLTSVTAADMPTGGTVRFKGALVYRSA